MIGLKPLVGAALVRLTWRRVPAGTLCGLGNLCVHEVETVNFAGGREAGKLQSRLTTAIELMG